MISAIALDLGTTSIKAGLLDHNGMLSHIVALPAPIIAVNNGYYESDALSYATLAEQALGACLAQANGSPPLGICSQRSSFLVWDRTSGRPLTPLISWQDNRGAASCEDLRASEELIRNLTGLRLTPYYFAPKLRVILRDHPEWRIGLERGEFLAGTLDTFLIWRWTGGRHFITDASMAARTLLMDIRHQQWSPALCDLFTIPLSILPEIKPSSGLGLRTDMGLTLQASLGDQSSALFASVGSDSTEALVNLGTGGFVIRYSHEDKPVQDGYLRTLVYQDNALRAHIASEGTLNSIAAALAPYPIGECQMEDMAVQEIFCVAEPSGLGAPYFRSDIGLRFSHPVENLAPREIAHLLLEGITFRVARILEDFHRESALNRVFLSGGLSELVCLQQGIAQCVPFETYRLQQRDTSLRGAALLAAGMAPACYREAEKIEAVRTVYPLTEKYRRWKEWFAALLKG
jgi:glycerol kinase